MFLYNDRTEWLQTELKYLQKLKILFDPVQKKFANSGPESGSEQLVFRYYRKLIHACFRFLNHG
jgi:hypothetical protein